MGLIMSTLGLARELPSDNPPQKKKKKKKKKNETLKELILVA